MPAHSKVGIQSYLGLALREPTGLLLHPSRSLLQTVQVATAPEDWCWQIGAGTVWWTGGRKVQRVELWGRDREGLDLRNTYICQIISPLTRQLTPSLSSDLHQQKGRSGSEETHKLGCVLGF